MVLCLLLLRYNRIWANIAVLLAVVLLYVFSGSAGFSDSLHALIEYPPIPWMLFFIVGVMIGRLLLWSGGKDKDAFVEPFVEPMGYAALVLMVALYFLVSGGYLFYPYPPTPVFIMIALCFVFSLFVVSFWIWETNKMAPRISGFLTTFGRYSLAIYVVHRVLLCGLFVLAGMNNKFGEIEMIGIMVAFSIAVFYSAGWIAAEVRKIRSRILRIISFVCDRKPS